MTPEREQQPLEENSSLRETLGLLREQNQLQAELIDSQREQLRNQEELIGLLRQKLDLVLRKLFGKSSEALDPAQLELLLGEPPGKAPASPTFGDAPVVEASAASVARPDRKPRRERIPDHLPVVEEVLLPEPVKACPEAWRRIGEERSDQLDYQPGRIFIRRLIRPTYVRVADRDAAPVTAKLPPRLQDGLTATPALIAHALVSKYCDHLPFYRQEQILARRHGVAIGRNTLCRWAELAAFWLKPLYRHIHEDLLAGDYLQADETPVKYLAPGTGKTGLGYLWTLHRPGGDVLYQWRTSRGSACLNDLLVGFSGILQSDGYRAYDTYAARHPEITQAACWAHARRKFHEAYQSGQTLAAGPLKAIGGLYAIEKELRQTRAGPEERAAIRREQSIPILEGFRLDLQRLRANVSVLPKSPLGRAIDYTLALWQKLETFVRHGKAEIDTNLTENAIRPTAVGKKNWMFVGGEDTGDRSAILYTLIESAKRHGHEPYAYLRDVLERLPGMKASEIDALLPKNWQPTNEVLVPIQAAS
ncbi:IS66 family transposase [Luteolibacter sp. LG18]|uniref:IS66 family transposase n=1 Tax=Luteolibacter sp. LG18 TaxID=2819286 RepID=UPI002B28E812|nr:transposase [Luteolibacter sp. LG18]BCU78552.1 transposase [Luteolibacter sp. LG18]